MLESDVEVTVEHVTILVEQIKELLGLHHWRISVKVVEDKQLGASLMRISPNRDRNIASLSMRKTLIGTELAYVGPLILHELLHLVLDPLAEEHQFQIEFCAEEARSIECHKRFVRSLEKIVEHLATHLAPLVLTEAYLRAV